VIYDEDYQATRCTWEKEQIFSSKSALVSMAMQLLACMSCALPTVFVEANRSVKNVDPEQAEAMDLKILQVSRIAATLIMSGYVAYILFQLVTHKRMLTIDEGADSDDDEDEDEGGLSAGGSLLLMAATTTLIAVSSEMLVGAIEEVVEKSTISSSFIGIILLPFAGNACEHASAIRFAIQDRPGLSIGIAVGSSTQIALFVVPFSVIAGKLMDQPMDLVFGSLNTTVMILSVLVALALVIDGRSNWLKGFMLCTAYTFEGILYWNETS
jgi:Ca2+:H+ antiporter